MMVTEFFFKKKNQIINRIDCTGKLAITIFYHCILQIYNRLDIGWVQSGLNLGLTIKLTLSCSTSQDMRNKYAVQQYW